MIDYRYMIFNYIKMKVKLLVKNEIKLINCIFNSLNEKIKHIKLLNEYTITDNQYS